MTTTVLERPTVDEFVATREPTPYEVFADAMERGARLVPQCVGESISYDPTRPRGIGSACALGAAALGLDLVERREAWGIAYTHWLWAALGIDGWTHMVAHPLTGETMSIGNTIVSLNDRHGWTRERIAAWLRTLS